jgi:hypothetical protein
LNHAGLLTKYRYFPGTFLAARQMIVHFFASGQQILSPEHFFQSISYYAVHISLRKPT